MRSHPRAVASDRGVMYSTVAELVRRSEVVVVVQPMTKPKYEAKGRDAVTSRYTLKLQEVLKGDLGNGSTIRVTVPGLARLQPDGKSIFLPAAGQPKLARGRSYLLFLTRGKDERARTYTLVGGRQGLFALNTKAGTVHMGGHRPEDPVARKYAKSRIKPFLAVVRGAVHDAGSK